MCATSNNRVPSRQVIEQTLHEIETVKLPEIERLFDLCQQRSIAVDYEMVDYHVIKDFIGYVRDDMRHRNMARAIYGMNCLVEISDNVLTSLNEYLTGVKRPFSVTRYVTDNIEIRGSSFIGRAVNPVNGNRIMRPLFFTGYGHFDQIINDMPKMTGFGVDILQTEVGPRDTIIEVNGGYGFNAAGLERIENILREAERHNVRVDVLLAPHYFPQWVLRKHPNLRVNSDYFLKFNVFEPEAKKVIETHIIGVMERIKDFRSLNSICLSNEPVFSTARNFNVNNKNAVVNVMWQQFLADTHISIENLNSVYRTNYRGFDYVPMPVRIEAAPQFYDWFTFNNLVFGEWHQWMAGLVHSVAPNIPVHSKIMDAVLSPTGGRTSLQWGVDPEQFAQFSQLSGNDANNYIFKEDANIISKMKWYDLLMSMRRMPIFNSEDHIIEDRNHDYIPQQVLHVRSDLWQGAIRGRAATTIWVWERTHERNSDFAGSILHRPDVVSVIGKTNLDLNRLAHEVTAFQNERARAAILFSNPARIYDSLYLNTVDKIYKSLIFNGQKAGFITERQLAAGFYEDYRIIIIPAAVHVKPSTLGAIRNFISRGGRVLVIGEESLSRDYYNRLIPGTDRNFIMENSTVIKNAQTLTEQELFRVTRNILTERGLLRVTLTDTLTGEPVYGVEWQSADYNGRLHINICNYDWSGSKFISIFVNNRPAGNATELISGNVINTGNIELAPYSPILLRLN